MIRLRWLVLGVIALPFLEFAAFFWVAGRVGFLGALFAVVVTSFLGIMILKGGARLLFAQMARGGVVILSDEAARNGMLTAFAGLLLAIPGFITDVFALVLLLPALKALAFGGLPASAPARRPGPTGVVDLDPQDWREEARRPPPSPRLDHPDRG
jgi:UPF0716 protein FxsA